MIITQNITVVESMMTMTMIIIPGDDTKKEDFLMIYLILDNWYDSLRPLV
jgi:hypothetical protein